MTVKDKKLFKKSRQYYGVALQNIDAAFLGSGGSATCRSHHKSKQHFAMRNDSIGAIIAMMVKKLC